MPSGITVKLNENGDFVFELSNNAERDLNVSVTVQINWRWLNLDFQPSKKIGGLFVLSSRIWQNTCEKLNLIFVFFIGNL